MRAPEGIERSHRKLYQSIRSELALLEQRKSRELLAYERAYARDLPKRIRVGTKAELARAASRARVVLVGDFHPFRQSQKGFLRLVEAHLSERRPAILGLECLQQAHQPAVDEFLSGYITVEELREKIEFERSWPFSWESYREILLFAKHRSLPVLALNIPERKRAPGGMLRERDRMAADTLASTLEALPGASAFVLYGELHLARRHLPADLRERLRGKDSVLVVHQNEAHLYFQAKRLPNGQKPELLRLGAGEFCLLNAVPWVKLRSYLDWLEGNPHGHDPEDGTDIPGTVHHYATLLAEALGLEARIRDDIEIFTPERLAALPAPRLLQGLSAADRALARHSLAFQRTGYLPGAGALLLPSASTNALSEAAAYLLRHSLQPETAALRSRSGSGPAAGHWLLHFLTGYLGSKALNPKRKCNEIRDLQELLRQKGRISRSRSQVIRRALSLLAPLLKRERLPARHAPLTGAREAEACRLAGSILGDRIFFALLREPGLLPFARELFSFGHSGDARKLLTKAGAKLTRAPGRPLRKKDRF